jgi:uncharacterized membrane protein required for colicin V production
VNSIDLLIVILIIAVAMRGVASGFLRQAGSLGGFALGLMVGAAVAPFFAGAFPPGAGRVLVVLFVFFGTALTIAGIGETVGY